MSDDVHFSMSKATYEHIATIARNWGLAETEVIVRALLLYGVGLYEREHGLGLAIVDGSGKIIRRVALP